MADQPQLDWSTAEVRDGTLTVPVSGETDDDWAQTFARTLALLSSGSAWGKVAYDSGEVTVDGVQEGSEENLRFALDGAAQEANAHADDRSDKDDGDADGESTDEDGEGDDTDRRMTDRFRGDDQRLGD